MSLIEAYQLLLFQFHRFAKVLCRYSCSTTSLTDELEISHNIFVILQVRPVEIYIRQIAKVVGIT
ncbi:MAG: hypothetical protein ACYSSP_06770 [Planctomycetota bacterium]